jgi:hemerythrin
MVRWNASLALGIPEIDRQHQALFAQVARFDAAVRAGESGRRLEELFGFLSAYAAAHFAAEEGALRESGYPDLERHAGEHTEFRRRLRSLVPHWESEGASTALLLALTGFLYEWLDAHVASSDQEAGRWLSSRAPRT